MSHLVLVGGLTGSGKSTVGKYLTRRVKYAYLDKDTLTRELVDALVAEAGSDFGPGDRDSVIYVERARPAEYQCFMNTVMENVSLGIPTIATAPFISEMNNSLWIKKIAEQVDDYDFKLTMVWLDCDLAITKRRLMQRNAVRDQIKMAIWEEYEAFAQGIEVPKPPVLIYDNRPEQSIHNICEKIINDVEHF